eukprot:TRINITY_DN68323_c0_g2_i1.p1 TRINITY_DN68323_c0_g2~~TRINITY_DN68323_c0_g2_i1.p1  ORF type:complete len:823 (-),score=197.74 TRINITY_DN68323_c0_g2_i1:9-2477(-)
MAAAAVLSPGEAAPLLPPGMSQETLDACNWAPGLRLAAGGKRPGLVVTVPELGDMLCTQSGGSSSSSAAPAVDASLLQSEPMVTWHPGGGELQRFCLLLVGRPAGLDDSSPGRAARLLWLVADIPGCGEADVTAPELYGLAGNHDAVARGSTVVEYEPPGSGLDMLLVLCRQTSSAAAADSAFRAACSQADFDVCKFLQDYAVGETGLAAVHVRTAAEASLRAGYPSATLAATADAPCSVASAYSSGGSLVFGADEPRQLTAALLRSARQRPERGLTVYDTSLKAQRITFADLWARASRIYCGLAGSDVPAGSPALLQVPTLCDHFPVFWACLLHRVKPVAVAIPPNYDDPAHAVCLKICNTWRLLQGPPVLTTAAHASKVAKLRSAPGMEALRLVSVEELEAVGFAAPQSTLDAVAAVAEGIEETEVAFYQLSSGSTGVPKCIQIAHRGVVAHVHGEAKFCGITKDEVHLNFLPVDHVVPILTVHCCDVYHGCDEIQLEVASIVSEPLLWLRKLHEHRATRTWAPNFAFKLVADALRKDPEAAAGLDLAACRYWMNAGEQVTVPVCEEFLDRTAALGVKRSYMQPAFGMAEACTCMTYNNEWDRLPVSRVGRSVFVNLGPPVPGVEIRITDEENVQVPEEVVGRFQIRGAVITPGYKSNQKANEEAFVGEEWFNSGDVGFIKDGRLYLTGREKEMIIIRGANFYCYEIEDVVNTLPSVTPTFTAAVSAHDPATGSESFAVFFVPAAFGGEAANFDDPTLPSVINQVRTELIKHISLTPSHVVPLARAEFPKTTSGKIQRSQLMKALRSGEFDERLRMLAAV